jgi:hypothetical protein
MVAYGFNAHIPLKIETSLLLYIATIRHSHFISSDHLTSSEMDEGRLHFFSVPEQTGRLSYVIDLLRRMIKVACIVFLWLSWSKVSLRMT